MQCGRNLKNGVEMFSRDWQENLLEIRKSEEWNCETSGFCQTESGTDDRPLERRLRITKGLSGVVARWQVRKCKWAFSRVYQWHLPG